MSKPELKILKDGTKIWWLDDDAFHRGGSAKIWPDGTEQWCLNGLLHREDGPAVTSPDGYEAWWLNGKYLSFDDYKSWFINKISNPFYKLTDGDVEFIREYLE